MTKKLEQYSDHELLDLKICDLRLSLKTSFVYPLIQKVIKELENKNICARPHFWVSDDWFCPDGILGIAIPFYLLHPRLIELERQQMGYVEGDSKVECLRILRHELGHVIDNAFELRKNRQRTSIFGKASTAYPRQYTYRHYSKNFVRNLDCGYAQSHPAEDFAETFAVWLTPNSNWRVSYRDWPAMTKLLFVNEQMRQIAHRRPLINSKEEIDPIKNINKTLRSYYNAKKKRNGLFKDRFWNHGFAQIFPQANNPLAPLASSFVRRHKKELCKEISNDIRVPQYLIMQMLNSFIAHSKARKLRTAKKEMTTRKHLGYYLTRKAKTYFTQGKHFISL